MFLGNWPMAFITLVTHPLVSWMGSILAKHLCPHTALLPGYRAPPTCILRSGTLNQTYPPPQSCISQLSGGKICNAHEAKGDDVFAKEIRESTVGCVSLCLMPRIAAVAMLKGTAVVLQQQNYLRGGGRGWATQDPQEGETATLESHSNTRSGLRAVAYYWLPRPWTSSKAAGPGVPAWWTCSPREEMARVSQAAVWAWPLNYKWD